jgi:tetratricopeptide (TPR) repeat protein
VEENSSNLNIFNGAPARFIQALPAFSGTAAFFIPVSAEKRGDATLYAFSPFSEAGQQFLTAFTDGRLLEPPFIERTPLETAVMFFNAPRHDKFMFNAPHHQAREVLTPLRASRHDLSLLAGFLASGGEAGGDPSRRAAGDFALGKLHSAHYFYAVAAERNPASRARLPLSSVLIELGLLQEAYDGLKTDRDPEALLNLAVIYRKTGNQQAARDFLAAIGPGTPLEDKKQAEYAWLDLEAGKDEEAEKAFRRLASSAFDKTDALSGLGAAISRAAFKTRDKGRLAEAASPASGRIFFQLGNLYFRSGDLAQSEACYRSSAAIAPTVQALANLALTLVRNGKTAEAAAVTLQVALTDIASAERLTAEFPKEGLAGYFPPPLRAEPQPAARPEPRQPEPVPVPEPQAGQPVTERPASGLDQAVSGFAFIKPGQQAAPAGSDSGAASLEPAQPHISSRGLPPKEAQQGGQPIETLQDVRYAQPSRPGPDRSDEFIARAFKLSSALEDELGKKIYFNLDGLNEVEKKLRLTFIKSRTNQQLCLDMVKDASAFLCYFLQERHKGRLLKFPDFDPWGWPLVIDQPDSRITTYPIIRIWRLLWEETVPEPGWIFKYADWLATRIKDHTVPPCGAEAAKGKLPSHPEKVQDAAAEHKRMLVLASSLPETSHIESGRSGLMKIDAAIKNAFKPDIPPTADGWRLLRCYGHMLAEIMVKDFKASWYNVDGSDGGWSMRLPWKTFIFPIGKVYKVASSRDDLGEYYEVLLADKVRNQ